MGCAINFQEIVILYALFIVCLKDIRIFMLKVVYILI